MPTGIALAAIDEYEKAMKLAPESAAYREARELCAGPSCALCVAALHALARRAECLPAPGPPPPDGAPVGDANGAAANGPAAAGFDEFFFSRISVRSDSSDSFRNSSST